MQKKTPSLRLDQRERDIISAAQLRRAAPVAKLRKLTGYRDHTIRYALQNCLESGVIRRGVFVNLFRLGFTQYEIFFSLSSEQKDSREKLLRALIDSEQVSWVGDLGGEYHYAINICVRDVREVADFMEDLAARLGLIFVEKAVAARLSLSFFGNKYLSAKQNTRGTLAYATTRDRVSIDETDHQILAALIRLNCPSRRDVAREIGLPFSTVDFRIRRLEQSKVIEGYYYRLDPALLGVQSYLLLVSAKGFKAERRESFLRFCREHLHIVLLIEAIGSWDFEIVVDVEESRRIIQVVQEIHDAFGAYIHSVKILPSFDYPKVREYPFRKYPAV